MARGSIRKHQRSDGVRYEAVVDLGNDHKSGKRRQRTKSFKSKKEAQVALAAMLTDIDKGTAVDNSRQTVAEMMEYWLDAHVRHRLRPKTIASYEYTVAKYIIPSLGAIQIQQLTPRRLQQFYIEKLEAGCGERTIRLCHLHLHQALKQAVDHGLVMRNVATLVQQPKSEPREMRVWTATQARTFHAAANNSVYGPIWQLGLSTGMRRGELLGIRWQDIDWEHKVLRVRQANVSVNGRSHIGLPKTGSAVREVPLHDEIIMALQVHKGTQEK